MCAIEVASVNGGRVESRSVSLVGISCRYIMNPMFSRKTSL